jgi:hypothetical protein
MVLQQHGITQETLLLLRALLVNTSWATVASLVELACHRHAILFWHEECDP